MLTVHHLENSRSQRVLWLLEELGVDYEVQRYARDPNTSLAPPELLAVHPLGKSPVITDDDRVVAETGAIIEYLIERYGQGRLLPQGESAMLDYRYWMHAAEGSVMPLLVMTLVFNRVETAPMPFFIRPIAKGISAKVKGSFINPSLERMLAHMDAALAATGWFAGEAMTAADIMMSFPVEAASARAGGGQRYPNLQAFADRIHALPGYQRALERGGPYELMS